MMKSISIIMFLFAAMIANGQTMTKDTLTQQTINDLLRSLNRKSADTTRIDIFLRLAEGFLYKARNEKKNLDSAAVFIRNAKELNAKQSSGKIDGLLLLHESSLMIKTGDTIAARQLVRSSIIQLQAINDEYNLTLALLNLSLCNDVRDPAQEKAVMNVYDTLFPHVPLLARNNQVENCMIELEHFYNTRLNVATLVIKLDFLDHFIRTCQIVDDKIRSFWARKEVADIHYQQGKLTGAIDELVNIANEQKAGDFPRTCFTYDLLAGLYGHAGNFDKALHYSLESIKSVSTAIDSVWLPNFYMRVASIYGKTGSLPEAIDWNLKQLNFMIARKYYRYIYSVALSITSDMISLGRQREALTLIVDKSNHFVPVSTWERRSMLLTLAKCYAAVNNIPMAEKYCDELLKHHELRIRIKEVNSDATVEQFLSRFYLSTGQFSKAEKYHKQYMSEMPTVSKFDILYESDFLFKLDSAGGNYLSAIKYLQNFHLVNDSIFNEAKSKQIEELKITYATEQKDSLISLKEQNIQLLTKQDNLQKSKLQQGVILRNISLSVVALLIIIMILLYNRYRLKQRTNKKLESQQAEISNKNLSLQHLVNEKEWLLKEIHHRVKNNLQIVMSLLNSQSAYIENDAALTAIHDSQHRVHAMSLIHQKLYNSENLSTIDMSFYIRELVSYLRDSFDTGRRIRFEFNIGPLELDVSQAVPLGLILNEAITNSIKYAFPDNSAGVINITLSNTAPNSYLLDISDNGIGMPAKTGSKKKGSLGMSLMAGLAEDLEGKFAVENDNGTTIKVSFVHDVNIKRPDILVSSFVTSN